MKDERRIVNGAPWRTVQIEEAFDGYMKDNQMVLQSKEKKLEIPIYQIKNLIYVTNYGSISIPLLQNLIENHVMVCFCDNKRIPSGKLCEISANYESAGRIMDQSKWNDRRKEAVWRQIVSLKISSEIQLLSRIGISVPDILFSCKKEILPGDTSNREAVAARAYFNALFGNEFVRFAMDNTNSALNYGYTILCNTFCRTITMHGYCTELGIHHCSRQNSYNFACDLMEPFRVFVDAIVRKNLNRELDIEYRKELFSVLNTQCMYNRKSMILSDAIEAFTLNVISAMEIPRSSIKKVGFCDV